MFNKASACRHALLRCGAVAILMCPAVAIEAAPSQARGLQLEQFFLGSLSGSGTTQDIQHGTRAVNFSGVGARTAGGLKLAFDTVFSDGERKHTIWTFTKLGDGAYVGHRDDLVGDARVNQNGNEIEMNYTAQIGTASGAKTLNFDEHFTLTAPGTITDRLTGTLLFINVASGEMVIHKSGA